MSAHQLGKIILQCAKMLVALLEKELRTTKEQQPT
jgi:hypothetical protein